MELIFCDRYYDSAKWEPGKYSNELVNHLSEFDVGIRITDTDIGHGADCPAILVQLFAGVDWSSFLTVAGAGSLFLLGDSVNKNLDAWVQIGKKLKKLFKKIKPDRIDRHAAALMAIDDCLQNFNSCSELILTLQIIEFSPFNAGAETLGKCPNALYLITIKSTENAIVYGIKSNGNIEFRHELNTNWYDF